MKFHNLITNIFLIASVSAMESYDDGVGARKHRRSSVPQFTFRSAFDYSIGIIELGGGDEYGIIEAKTLRTVRNAINIGVITQDELDYVLYRSLQYNLLKIARCVLTISDSTKITPSQRAINDEVGLIFDSQLDPIYRARVSHLFMQVASGQVGSSRQINCAIKKYKKFGRPWF